MSISHWALICGLGIVLAAPTTAQEPHGTLFVSGNMDIFQSGGQNDGSGGVPPFAFTFPAASNRFLIFESILGLWTCADGNPVAVPWGPDGTSATGNACYPRASIKGPVGSLSGYETTDFTGALVGVFLEDSLPGTAPPALRFYVSDHSEGGIPTSFGGLRPAIGQVFFVGDGLTGSGTGVQQTFLVPPTATRLFLGYVDSCSASGYAGPGCYGDNGGAVIAAFHITPPVE
jgi:hypothetical protein